MRGERRLLTVALAVSITVCGTVGFGYSARAAVVLGVLTLALGLPAILMGLAELRGDDWREP